jgi:hypothetical protein
LGKIELTRKEIMLSVRTLTVRVRDYFSNLPFRTYDTILLEGIGLFANLIAILTFFGAVNTPEESPNFYINNQEFLVWSLVALIYTAGLLRARFKRRWRKRVYDAGIDEDSFAESDPRWLFFRGKVHFAMFKRDFAFTLATTFPITFLYIRALDAAYTEGSASPWLSLSETATWCVPVTLGIMLSSSIFDKALSLYAGD